MQHEVQLCFIPGLGCLEKALMDSKSELCNQSLHFFAFQIVAPYAAVNQSLHAVADFYEQLWP